MSSNNDDTNSSSKVDDNDDDEEKRFFIQETNNDDDDNDAAAPAIGDTGDAVDLEEGEIDDDVKEDENNIIKKSHKRKRKHKNRKKRKTAIVYEDEVNAYEQSPDKKLKAYVALNHQPQSLLSLPLLMNEDNLFKKKSPEYNFNDRSTTQNDEIKSNQQQTVKSLFDLLSNSLPGGVSSGFFDPTITEKENSKPAKQQETKEAKKMTKKERRELGILSKKEIKKKKYLESVKEKQKRELEWKEKTSEMICKFYLEGRCTKGDECQFSHKAPLPKKTEICKYYLNGYCAKNSNCTFMHAEFPCKFYHTNNKECKSGDNCRFSHEPLTAETREILMKFINESENDNKSPPSLLKNPQSSSIPSLMGINVNVKKQQPPSLMSFEPLKQQNELPALFSQDIDERCGDIDERSSIQQHHEPQNNLITNLFENPIVKLLQKHQPQPQDLVTSLLPALLTAAAAVPMIKTPDSLNSLLFKNFHAETIEIDARTDGSVPYKAVPIDIPESSLWTKLPISSNKSSDSECDPRIEYYSNKANNKNLNNNQELIKVPTAVNNNLSSINSQQQQYQINKTKENDSTALSPPPPPQPQYSSQNEVKHYEIHKTQQTREYRDPRLSSKSSILNISELSSLLNQNQQQQNKNINNRGDVNSMEKNKQTNNNRLTFADYKRKVQKEMPANDYLTRENNFSNPFDQQQSYSIGINEFKAPQSLHELLKNYPS